MGYAWADGYWVSYTLGGDPRLSIMISTTSPGSGLVFPWKYLSRDIRLDVIKQQLKEANLWVQWDDLTNEITRIVTYRYL